MPASEWHQARAQQILPLAQRSFEYLAPLFLTPGDWECASIAGSHAGRESVVCAQNQKKVARTLSLRLNAPLFRKSDWQKLPRPMLVVPAYLRQGALLVALKQKARQ